MKHIIALIALLALAAGCTQPIIKPADNGIRISQFYADMPPELESGRSFRLYIGIENVGETTASNVEARLYGVSWDEPEAKGFSELQPPNPRRGSPGGADIAYWQLAAPQLPEGITHTYNIIGRVYYDYSTSAAASIPVINEDEYNRRRLQGISIGNALSVSSSSAPVKVEVTGSSPVIVRKEGGSEHVFYNFIFRNAGTGVPVTGNINGLIIGEIRILGDGASFGNCITGSAGSIQLSENEQDGVLIRRGESVTLPCEIVISRSAWESKPLGTMTIVFDLKYRYYTDSEVAITVIGREPLSDSFP